MNKLIDILNSERSLKWNCSGRTKCVHLEPGSFELVQFGLQQLLGHLHLALEAISILIGLIGFEWVLVGSLSVRAGRAGLPLSSKHNGVPKFQPLEQTAVGELERNGENDSITNKKQSCWIKESFKNEGRVLQHYEALWKKALKRWHSPGACVESCIKTWLTSSLRSSVYCWGENLSTHSREVRPSVSSASWSSSSGWTSSTLLERHTS